MRVLIRVDAGSEHGLGHLSRMLALARALEAQDPGSEAIFVTTTPRVVRPFVGDGFEVWGYAPLPEDGLLLAAVVAARGGNVLVVDKKYAYHEELLTELRARLRVVRIDYPDASAESCDLLVLPGAHYDAAVMERIEADFGERVLVGRDYVLLSDAVMALTPWRFGRWSPRQQLVFYAGGSDPWGALPQLYEMTRPLSHLLPDVHRTYLVGSQATWPQTAALDPLAALVGYHPKTLQKARLAVGLFGVSAYEALYLRTPLVTLGQTAAHHAAGTALMLASHVASHHLGLLSGWLQEDLCGFLAALWHSPETLRQMHRDATGWLDGKGAQRVARAILALGGSACGNRKAP